MELPYFGFVNPEALEEVYEIEYPIDSSYSCALELWFESESVPSNELMPIDIALKNLSQYLNVAQKYLESEPVGIALLKKYLSHHKDLLSAEDNERWPSDPSPMLYASAAMKPNLHIKSISLWHGSPGLVKIDYSLGHDLTDYVICLELSNNFKVSNIAIES